MVYRNYKCPLCDKIFYIKDNNLDYDHIKKICINDYGLVSSNSNHDCLFNMKAVEQKILYTLVSISKYQLPLTEKF